ncbi:MAG: prepilin-type N-terminal cleavage/methylation domain-containing protein [Betaproteobacteria bacterium]|nr:prepilin-type N-terminal cleavage/methylation domain-containing protein [Betaproteobacteria bacterium]
MRKSAKGFTLVELIVVIAVEVARAKFYATGTSPATVTAVDGTVISVGTAGAASGVPIGDATGIGRAANIIATTYTGAYTAGGVSTFTLVGGPAGCNVTYNDTNGVVSAANAIAANC